MAVSSAFSGEGPARASIRRPAPGETWHGIDAERLELVSRGDVVTGWLARAALRNAQGKAQGKAEAKAKARAAKARSALLMAVHDSAESASATELGIAAGWIGPELSLVAIDLPLHGHRASPKLSERLIAGLVQRGRGDEIDRNGQVLVEEFWRQATVDLIRTLDAVLALGGHDPKRIGLLGIGLGAALVETLLARDDRPRAAVLIRPPNAKPASLAPMDCAMPAGARSRPSASSDRRAAAAAERLVIEAETDASIWGAAARTFFEARLRQEPVR